MEVTIGVQNVSRELTVETDAPAAEVSSAVDAALASPDGVLRLTDTKGRTVLVPGRALGWVQVGESEKGKVGFGAI
ncbi:DUF3107 domain-containing protein [Phycicoccus endophyticus]|uniref:DUF3107 domain-containing protein n=1 Tax=Phycicoccus endophyticus TaxID=1690220 RepID=A0A7G9QYU4_9MICO|nr:DUF3107 domain-containing protein [Phycicoccus endophyticus]NHI20436.1 DUF3107 domain-containing protein [Phycicoccus endophyticus]QNN48519.1 DUF3107 domain-containing protein [Phycicoccus endophyticus]GGL30844.1 ATP-binding protein [Phycicoccus endophyticus]